MIQAISQEDILEWPDGTWCFRYELHEMAHKSDDYITHAEGTAHHAQLAQCTFTTADEEMKP